MTGDTLEDIDNAEKQVEEQLSDIAINHDDHPFPIQSDGAFTMHGRFPAVTYQYEKESFLNITGILPERRSGEFVLSDPFLPGKFK